MEEHSEVGHLRDLMNARFDGLDAKIDGAVLGLNAKFDGMSAKMDGMSAKMDAMLALYHGMARDVQKIQEHVVLLRRDVDIIQDVLSTKEPMGFPRPGQALSR